MALVSCQSLPWRHSGYDVKIVGMKDKDTVADLKALSEAWQYRRDPDIEVSRLGTMFRGDAFNMTRYLRANGFCDANVTSSVTTNGKRSAIVFTIQGTNLYHIRDVRISIVDGLDVSKLNWTNTMSGKSADFATIEVAGRSMVRALKNAGYPYAVMQNKSATVDHENRTVDVDYELAARHAAVLGGYNISGLRRVKPEFVARKINWKPGDTYRQDTINSLSRKLTGSSLFSFIDISGPPVAATSSVYDVNIRLQERKRRTIGLGVGYQSDLGPEITFFWQHRNLFGMGEKFEIDAKYSADLWLGTAIFTLPDVFHTDNSLDLGVKFSEEDSDAYDVRYQALYAKLHHRIKDDWRLEYGPAVRDSEVTQREIEENYLHVSFPVAVSWDKRDDDLNPMKGMAVNASAEPFYDLEENGSFTKALLTPMVYIPITGDTLSLGARLTLGSIYGASSENVPADLRFYAGGGQSIRGYEYQSVGPREDGQLIGGKSLVETSFELRWQFGKNLGLVAFLDGGSAYEPEFSDFSESYQWGTGLGFRYFTGVGPIRVDVGVPVNPRDGIDHNFEFYISIGQAF